MPTDPVVEALGPFLIPVVIFLFGLVGYLLLFFLTRRGILGGE